MISLMGSRKEIVADMIFTGIMKMTFGMSTKDLEEVAEFFEHNATFELVEPSDAMDKAEHEVYMAIATFARQLIVIEEKKSA